MACQPTSCVPRAIDAGTTVVFHVDSNCHPSSEWTGVLVFNNGIDASKSVTMTANTDGRQFDVTLTPTFTAALALGSTMAIPLFTRISDSAVEYGNAQTTVVLPAITATATPSTAQAMVTLLTAALARLAASKNASVSFNGQSFTKANISTYRDQLTYWQAIVIQEQEELTMLRGGRTNDGRIQTEFVGPCNGPLGYSLPGVYLGGFCQ